MPRGTVLATAPRVPSLRRLVELKKNWNVSVAALAHRLHAVGVLSEWHYRQLCIDMNQRGYRKREPEGTQRETSQVLSKVLKALRAEGITKQAIAKELASRRRKWKRWCLGSRSFPSKVGMTTQTPRRAHPT